MGRPPTILVVDDHPVDRKLASVILGLSGYRVVAVATAEEALARLPAERPDLLLVDHDLPGLSGLELATRLRSDAATRGLPILAMTSTSGPGAPERSAAAGCDGFLPKPVDVATLPAAVARCLAQGRSA